MYYRHVDPARGQEATAPYNFVPLPRKVLTAEQLSPPDPPPWRAHDRFLPGTRSGWIDLEVTTETPLFIRGPQRQDSAGGWEEAEARKRPEAWADAGGRPVIPGSSLRGMLRTLVEILSFAKLTPVSDERPFYRSLAADSIAFAYRERMTRGDGPDGGFVEHTEGRWQIRPASKVLRVSHAVLQSLSPAFTYRQKEDDTPPWELQHRQCWVRVDTGDQVTDDKDIKLARPTGPRWKEGVLVLTGSAPNKKAEFVFLLPAQGADPIPIPDRLWQRFHDEEQITQWQEKAFPVGKPPGTRPPGRKAPGHLRPGEPVFYLLDEAERSEDNPKGLVFFGRARLFRLPYDRSPRDLLPEEHRSDELDLAEALFGRVPAGRGRGETVRSRVRVGDCVAAGDRRDWYEPVIEPEILGRPQVTTYSHYLTQDGAKPPERYTTYLSTDHTTLRGHKLYWHRWDPDVGLGAVGQPTADGAKLGEMRTRIRPVRAGTVFRGRIRFENLMDAELGALLTALDLPEGCRHKLGMAKPLGLGTVRIRSTLHLIDREARYASWSASGTEGQDAAEVGAACREAFERLIVQHAERTREPTIPARQGLRRIARLDALYLLLDWEGRPPRERTAYLDLDAFKERKVLPTPHHVRGEAGPAWPAHDKVPAPWTGRPAQKGSGHGKDGSRRGRGRKGAAGAGARQVAWSSGSQQPLPPSRLLAPGIRVRCEALPERAPNGRWRFRLLGVTPTVEGVLEGAAPPGLQPGDQVDLVIVRYRPGDASYSLRWQGGA